ncbi:MAG: hypothetical protein ACRCTE_00905 [Cellulosilyticaceae bacterium]
MKTTTEKEPLEMDTPLKGKPKKSKFKWLIVFIILIGLGAGIYLGRTGIAKAVKDVPFLNQIFKEKSQDAVGKVDPQITALNDTITQLNNQIATQTTEKEQLQSRIKTLEKYEQQYNEFEQQKQKWENEVATQKPADFIAYYEQVRPDEANRIYKELKQTQIATAEQKQYAKVVADMEEEQAAKAIEKIIGTNPELVKFLFGGMSSERQSAILSVMDEKTAPQVIKLIAPQVQNNQ